ncbi:TerD family protein [Breznakiellaceae bacterium SP9]
MKKSFAVSISVEQHNENLVTELKNKGNEKGYSIMAIMKPGFKTKLDGLLDLHSSILVEIAVAGNDKYDYSCFALNTQEKLYAEPYFVFFNNLKSPGNEISMSQTEATAVFAINLTNLTSGVQKLAFTVTIDEESHGVMGAIKSCSTKIIQNNATVLQLDLTGADFKKQKAIILIEIYNKNGWRVSAVANGFNGGLADLLREYGYEEEITHESQSNDMQPAVPQAPQQEVPPSSRSTSTPASKPPSPPSIEVSTPAPKLGDEDYFEPKEGDWI